MTRSDREKAFSLRLDGCTWEKIGDLVGYDASVVRKDLRRIVDKQEPTTAIIYKDIADYVDKNCAGSIYELARQMHINPYRLRRSLVMGDPMPDSMKQKILLHTGLTEESLTTTIHE